MKKMINGCLVMMAIFVISGCASTEVYRGPRALLNRATFDLSCPIEQLVVVDIDANTKGVSGCGKKATYIRMNYSWIANTPVQQ